MENKMREDKQEILDFIKSLRGNYVEDFVTPSGADIDVYYPSRKMGIRLSGYFWKPNDNPKQMMTKGIKDGIRIVHIYDYEWNNCKENFKEFLKNFINSRGKRMIRSTEVKEIGAEEFADFLKENHLFVDTIKGCTVMYGIYENDLLVSVAGFNKRNSKLYDWEWKRFSIRYGWMSEHNLAKYFLKEFEKNHTGVLVDYQQCDRFPFTTDEEMGFVKKGSNAGVVSINVNTGIFTRHGFIPEKPLTKEETMKKYGFDVEVKTCGTVTWLKVLENNIDK
jgi:hypothetical protein